LLAWWSDDARTFSLSCVPGARCAAACIIVRGESCVVLRLSRFTTAVSDGSTLLEEEWIVHLIACFKAEHIHQKAES